MNWQPIETAPKGGGAKCIDDPAYVRPPQILLLCANKQSVCYWDWYYAKDGNGYTAGHEAWVEPISGELFTMHYGNPTHWMPLPDAPKNNQLER